MPEVFETPPNDGGIYLKRRDGRYERIVASTVPAPIGATHAARRQDAPEPSSESNIREG